MSHILHDHISQDVYLSRLSVHRHMHRVSPAGVQFLRRLEVVAGLQPCLAQVVPACGRCQAQDLGQGQAHVRGRGAVLPPHPPCCQCQLGGINVQVRRRHRQHPVPQLLCSPVDSIPRQRRPAAGVCAPAVGRQVGAAVVHGDGLQRHAEPIGADLREDGLVPLSHRRDAQVDGHFRLGGRFGFRLAGIRFHTPFARQRALERAAGVGDGDPRAFSGITRASALYEARRPHAVILPVDLFPDLRLERVIAYVLQRLPQQRRIVAAVVDDRV